MKKQLNFLFLLLVMANSFAQDSTFTKLMQQDWPNLKKYRPSNEKLQDSARQGRVVFMGNSITEGWVNTHPQFFSENNYIGRGISGQTTPQMLIRFMPDVIDLHPEAVVILAGTNDIAGNTGFSSPKMIKDNIKAMSQLASANGIKVILCSILPAYRYPWRPEIKAVQKISKLNHWLQEYSKEKKYTYVDYYNKMLNSQKGMKDELSLDGVHPNSNGYSLMEPIIKTAINKTLKR